MRPGPGRGARGCARGVGCAIERSSTRGERPRTATPAGMRPAYIRSTGAAAAAHSRAARTVRSERGGERGAGRGHSHFLGWVGGRQVGRAGNCAPRSRPPHSPSTAALRVGAAFSNVRRARAQCGTSGGGASVVCECVLACRAARNYASGTRSS